MSENKLITTTMLKDHSSFQIGGMAKFYAEPETLDELQEIIYYTRRNGLETCFFGYGSNLLFPDQPNPDTCFVSLKRLNRVEVTDRLFIAQAGLPLSSIALLGLFLKEERFLFTYLLPGSIGAGLYINARYFDSEISQIVDSIGYIDLNEPDSEIRYISAQDADFSYKNSIFQQKEWLIVEARFSLEKPVTASTAQEMMKGLADQEIYELADLKAFKNYFHNKAKQLDNYTKYKEYLTKIEDHRDVHHHFCYPSAGSIFKNSRQLGEPVGRYVEKLGLKGLTKGGAMISSYHGNIIVNLGKARADDVIYLIDKIRERILMASGINLEPEIKIIK